ncbi:MAG TPA: DUF642 domain-containing protein [Candidatus Baltobacteraceae bacterium]|jgi:hypothetical protein|nr:DUF642 domain-containing protein [Candidatus Baltobacteraceae bacterium]
MSKLEGVRASLSVLVAAMLAACAAQPSADMNGVSPDVTSRAPAPPPANCPVDRGGTGILPDGDFSQTSDPGYGFYESYNGQSFAPAWTVARRTIDFLGSKYWNVGHFCSIDLDGSHAGGMYSTSFSTKRGKSYRVEFILSGNGTFDRYDPEAKTMSLQAENQIHIFTWNVSGSNDAQHGRYAYQTWTFQADRTITTLTFLSRDHKASSAGPVVADISVTGK